MNSQLTAMCQMFLFPASVLVTGHGIARNEGLKATISFIGIVLSGAWIYRVSVWPDLSTPDRYTAMILAGVFFIVAACSFLIHVIGWLRPRETSPSALDMRTSR
jgi:hypothetical protein